MLEIVVGLVSGYLTVSVCESFFHRTIQHAGPGLRSLYLRAGRVGAAVLDAWYSHHIVHHVLTFRTSHVSQFTSEAERQKLDAHLASRGHADIIESSYGARLGTAPSNYARYVAPTLPLFLLLCWFGGPFFTLGALVPLAAVPILAQFVHPHLHLRYADVLAHGPLLTRCFARTAYFRYLARHHWLHHRYARCNYNLLLGGDWILCVHRPATAQDFEEMRAIGLWVPNCA